MSRERKGKNIYRNKKTSKKNLYFILLPIGSAFCPEGESGRSDTARCTSIPGVLRADAGRGRSYTTCPAAVRIVAMDQLRLGNSEYSRL